MRISSLIYSSPLELTLDLPENLVAKLKERHGVRQSDIEELAVSFFSKLATEPKTIIRDSPQGTILDELTEKLSEAGVYDLPCEPIDA